MAQSSGRRVALLVGGVMALAVGGVVGIVALGRAGGDEVATGTVPATTAPEPIPGSSITTTTTTGASTTTAPPVDSPSTSAATRTSTTTSSSTTIAVPADDSDAGWAPACVDRTGEGGPSIAPDPRLDTFGPLGAEPGLRITAPSTRDVGFGSSTTLGVGTIPGGLLVKVDGDFSYQSWILAAVDHDGTVRWRRCVEGGYVGSMVTGTNTVFVTEYAPGPGIDVTWRAFDLASGVEVPAPEIPSDVGLRAGADGLLVFARREGRIDIMIDRLHLLDTETGSVTTIPYPERADFQEAHQVYLAVDDDGTLRHLDPWGVTVGVFRGGVWATDAESILAATEVETWYDYDAAAWSGRDGLGEIVWSHADLRDPSLEGFRRLDVGELTLLNTCADRLEGDPCVDPALVALETATGDIRWRLAGLRTVPAAADGYALISNGSAYADGPFGEQGDGYVLVDIDTGEPVAGSQRWAGIETFYQGCCGEGDYRWVSRSGGLVIVVDGEHISVWYPLGLTIQTTTLDLMS